MYLLSNSKKYKNANRITFPESGSLVFISNDITSDVKVSDAIATYRDDGFLLCVDDPAEYKHIVVADGSIRLMQEPMPEGIAAIDESIYPEDIEAAIREGANSI